jgi:hyperosmotically inducible protein
MKRIQWVMPIIGIVVALGMDNTYAQGGPDNASTTLPAASAPTAKEVRAENRKLRKAVLLALSKTRGLNVDRIVVVAKGGSILLEGYVPEANQIDLATSVAQGVPGVTAVSNTLIVQAIGL